MTDPVFPIEAQVECVLREINQRSHVYPRLVAKGRMTAEKAAYETQAMRAILLTLQELEAKGRLI